MILSDTFSTHEVLKTICCGFPNVTDGTQVEKVHSFCKSIWMHHQEQRMLGIGRRWRRRFVELSDLSWLRLVLMLCTLQKVLMELCFSDASELPPAIFLTMNSALTNSVNDWHL